MKGYYFNTAGSCLDFAQINNHKNYFIKTMDEKMIKLYCISLIKTGNQLYLYLFDLFNNTSHMIHVFSPNEKYHIVEPYIQVSSDMKIITIPDNDYLYFYNIVDIITDHLLHPKFGIKIHMIHLTIDKSSDYNLCNDGKITVPHKCIMGITKYVMVFDSKIVVFCLVAKTVITLNVSFGTESLSISKSCEQIGYYRDHNITVHNTTTQCDKKIEFHNIPSAIILSDDGKYIIACQKESLFIYKYADEYVLIKKDYYHRDYYVSLVGINDIELISQLSNKCDITHIIYIWDKKRHNIQCNLISERKIYNRQEYELAIDTKIKYIYANSMQYVFIYESYIVLYDMHKLIPLFIINATLEDLTKLLTNEHCQNDTQEIIVKGKSEIKKNYVIKKWFSDMITYDALFEISINSLMIDMKPILSIDMILIEMIIFCLHDYKTIDNYATLMGNEPLSTNDIEHIFNVWQKVNKKIVGHETEYKSHYVEYILIKFLLLYMTAHCTTKKYIVVQNKFSIYKTKSNTKIKQIDISMLVQIFRQLLYTKKYFMNAVQIMTDVNLVEYVATKS